MFLSFYLSYCTLDLVIVLKQVIQVNSTTTDQNCTKTLEPTFFCPVGHRFILMEQVVLKKITIAQLVFLFMFK